MGEPPALIWQCLDLQREAWLAGGIPRAGERGCFRLESPTALWVTDAQRGKATGWVDITRQVSHDTPVRSGGCDVRANAMDMAWTM